MVVHPAYSEQRQQSPVAAATAARNKLSFAEARPPPKNENTPLSEDDNGRDQDRAACGDCCDAIAADQPPQQQLSPPSPAAAASDLAADQWYERNSVALLEACCNHNLVKATSILEQSSEQVKPERMKQLALARDDFRDSALHLASGQGEVDIVRLLLARGADVNAENNLGSSPLNRAAVAGRAEV